MGQPDINRITFERPKNMRHHGNFEKMEEYPPLLKINEAFLNGRECDVSYDS